jgi:hypothetical protein
VRQVPIYTIAFDHSRDAFGLRCHFPGRPPHDQMTSFPSIDAVLRWIDPHCERIWEAASDADESKVVISRAYVPGTVAARV